MAEISIFSCHTPKIRHEYEVIQVVLRDKSCQDQFIFPLWT